MNLDSIWSYAVKSMAGVQRTEAQVGPRGLDGDRRWMVVDNEGRFVTARFCHALLKIKAYVSEGGLLLDHQGDQISIPVPTGVASAVVVWKDTVSARDAGDEIAEWLSQRLGRSLRLVYQADDDYRYLPVAKHQQLGDQVSFADGYPLLLIGTASLESLNEQLDSPVTMRNFRPNLVVETEQPFVEDEWSTIEVGGVRFAVSSQCVRCVLTTVDPDTAVKSEDNQPLKTLLQTRRRESDGRPVFGMNLIPMSQGVVRVGDRVNVL